MDNEFSVVSFNPESTTSTPPPESTQSPPQADVGMTSSVNENSNSERSSEVLPASIEPAIEPSGIRASLPEDQLECVHPQIAMDLRRNKLKKGEVL